MEDYPVKTKDWDSNNLKVSVQLHKSKTISHHNFSYIPEDPLTKKRNRLNQTRLLLKAFLSLKLHLESEKFEKDNRLLREKINTRDQLNYELENMKDEEVIAEMFCLKS